MYNRLWHNLQERLGELIDGDDFELWITPLFPLESSQGEIALECPNAMHRSMVRDRYLGLMRKELDALAPGVSLQLKAGQTQPKRTQAAEQLAFNHKSFVPPVLNRRFVFDRFVAGGGNELAFAAARSLARGKQLYSNSLFLVSNTGLGKSHLTQAVGHQVLGAKPGLRVEYLTVEEFTNQMVSALRRKQMEGFKERYRRCCDLLLLEEVQFLSGKEKTQEELGYTLDNLMDAGKRVVFTSSQPADRIKGLRHGLESRLSAGITVSIEPPDHRTRVRILEKFLDAEGVRVDTEVLEFLAQEISGDVRRLQSALVSLLTKGSLTNRPYDLDLASEVLGQMNLRLKQISLEQVKALVARVYGMEQKVLTGKGRSRAVTKPRNLAMAICRRHTDASYAVIGKAFNRDHATVMYGVNKIERELGQDPRLKQELSYLEQKLGVD